MAHSLELAVLQTWFQSVLWSCGYELFGLFPGKRIVSSLEPKPRCQSPVLRQLDRPWLGRIVLWTPPPWQSPTALLSTALTPPWSRSPWPPSRYGIARSSSLSSMTWEWSMTSESPQSNISMIGSRQALRSVILHRELNTPTASKWMTTTKLLQIDPFDLCRSHTSVSWTQPTDRLPAKPFTTLRIPAKHFKPFWKISVLVVQHY